MSEQPKPDQTPAHDLPAATDADGPALQPKGASGGAEAPMSDVQRTTLESLCREAGVVFDAALSTAAAARRISELQRAKDRDAEAARVARGAPSEALPSDVGEEDPGAALDAPGSKQAVGDQVDTHEAHEPPKR